MGTPEDIMGIGRAMMFVGHCNKSRYESHKQPSSTFKEAQEMTESFSAGSLIARTSISERKA